MLFFQSPQAAPRYVLKFGGTSVSSAASWQNIEEIVRGHLSAGARPFVVCSAMAGVTDQLEALLAALDRGADPGPFVADIFSKHDRLGADLGIDAAAATATDRRDLERWIDEARGDGRVSPRLRAEITALGERMSTRLGARWLSERGLDVTWLDARELLVADPPPAGSADGQGYLSATCGYEPTPAVAERLATIRDRVIITQGFTARNEQGETVLLGRGGSDTSAAYFAAIIGAARLEIWTDVPGMFTANPRQVPGARLLTHLDYRQAEVQASLGGKVLHPRCLQPVREKGIPLQIGWTARPAFEGTVIADDPERVTPGAKAVSSRSDLCLISMRRDPEWQPVGFMAEVAACFGDRGLSMDLISSSPSAICVTLDLAAFPAARHELDALLTDLSRCCEPEVHEDVASVSLVGTDVRSELHRLGDTLRRLGEPYVHLTTHAADDSNFSAVVDADAAHDLVAAIHGELFETGPAAERLGPTWVELQADQPGPRGVQGDGAAPSVPATTALEADL